MLPRDIVTVTLSHFPKGLCASSKESGLGILNPSNFNLKYWCFENAASLSP
jgi:hypothetical protein